MNKAFQITAAAVAAAEEFEIDDPDTLEALIDAALRYHGL